jgi:hypothetical protein
MTRIVFLTLTIIAATAAFITQGFISYDSPAVAGAVNQYGAAVSRMVRLEVVHPGTLRSGILTPDEIVQMSKDNWVGLSWQELQDYEGEPETFTVVAVTPDASQYSEVINDCLDKGVKVIVESSGMDAWHATEDGLQGLKKMTSKAMRVVVFDGGHHLPTLALQPDLIIVPLTKGYVAHGYTRDAMKIDELLTMLRREQIRCPVVSIPRWGLVKTPASMNRIAIRALAKIPLGEPVSDHEGQILGSRCTGYGEASFWYVSHIGKLNWEWLESVDVKLKRIYIAFNYDCINREMAAEFVKSMRRPGVQAIIVNEPLDVAGVIFRGG